MLVVSNKINYKSKIYLLDMNIRNNKGFTLLEVLLVVAAIAILAGIVILAINPSKQLGETRDAQRWADVNTVLNAVYQYSIDHGGNLPGDISTSTTEICTSTATSTCSTAGLTYLGDLFTGEVYLVSMPVDPSGNTSTDGAGYEVYRSAINNRITVHAPDAEQTSYIGVTR